MKYFVGKDFLFDPLKLLYFRCNSILLAAFSILDFVIEYHALRQKAARNSDNGIFQANKYRVSKSESNSRRVT